VQHALRRIVKVVELPVAPPLRTAPAAADLRLKSVAVGEGCLEALQKL
jgi:hypothetical protein